jgi:nitrite reductase/ring-hydroxylating ferredoxin subunit
VIVNGHRLVLARLARGFAVFDDRCTHRGGSLADGVCIGGTVQCLWHGSQFDCATGAVSAGPAKEKIRVYAVKEEQGRVLLVSPPG